MNATFIPEGEYECIWFPNSASHGTFVGGFVLLLPADGGLVGRTIRSVLVSKHTQLQVPVTVTVEIGGVARITKIHGDDLSPRYGSSQVIPCYCVTTKINAGVGRSIC